MMLVDGCARTKADRVPREYRGMTLEEIKILGYGDHAQFRGNDGKVRNIKINGAVKRWKRSPDRVEVPVKYGLYEYGRFDTREALDRFVVAV